MNISNIRIVLVNTTHPGNIGAVARAMKTMGLTKLVLVNPKLFPHPEADAMSSRAEDILQQARVVPTLRAAINDCHLVVGASARLRALEIETLDPNQIAPIVLETAHQQGVAIVFGREATGLTNEELDLCHQLLHIPSDPHFSSLNLAQAVQIVCYELRMAYLRTSETRLEHALSDPEQATIEETEGFFNHLEKTLWDIHFIRPSNPKEVMRKLRRLYGRTRLKKEEINILRGVLTATKQFGEQNEK